MRPGILIAFAFVVFVALVHVVRLIFQVPIAIGGIAVPMWPSVLAVPLFAGLALQIWRETHPRAGGTR